MSQKKIKKKGTNTNRRNTVDKDKDPDPDNISRFGIVFLFSNIACVSKGKTVTISHTLERNRWG